jgi:hypothetical protein
MRSRNTGTNSSFAILRRSQARPVVVAVAVVGVEEAEEVAATRKDATTKSRKPIDNEASNEMETVLV